MDEKLSRTLNDRLSASFKQVSDQLEAVYKGLGDMQSIATGVGDLKRVLGNVKARGILGEVQLGAILADILTPDQYLENVATKPGASERVEFAVKLPVDEGDPVLNSLQMSYQTFKLQKRTDDALRVLSAVKAELPRYQAALRRAQQQIETAGKTVEGIITTRTNVMERKLKDIDALEDAKEADEILGLTSAELLADQKDED